MRIAGFLKVRNGLLRDRELPLVFDQLSSLCDEVFVADDASLDGTAEWLRERLPARHIVTALRGEHGFARELFVKQKLLERIHSAGPWDFILWLDSDELLDVGAAAGLRLFAQAVKDDTAVGYAPRDYVQLWGTPGWRRTDGIFGATPARSRLWRYSPELAFRPHRGLGHLDEQVPWQVRVGEQGELLGGLLHFGWTGQRRRLRVIECAGVHGPRARLYAAGGFEVEAFDQSRIPQAARAEAGPQPTLEDSRRETDALRDFEAKLPAPRVTGAAIDATDGEVGLEVTLASLPEPWVAIAVIGAVGEHGASSDPRVFWLDGEESLAISAAERFVAEVAMRPVTLRCGQRYAP